MLSLAATRLYSSDRSISGSPYRQLETLDGDGGCWLVVMDDIGGGYEHGIEYGV